ncbi:MAG: UvrD-helicase domain-containing protein, partial [Defluviitaleaceae bacterium]|nr:UvrD-helicase domain-containing protein [Defluviitaleaceae bacterium]
MFDYGHANENQRKAISQADGPVLLIAGPGTGKTFTLVQRAIYLIQERGVAPEQILMATFTEKAAKEIITRITNELDKRNISVNINEMYIGTFHSICLRLLKENIEHSRLKCNYRVLDQFDQTYTIYQNIHSLRKIDGFELVFDRNWWKASEEANNLTSKLLEEIVLPSELKKDTDPAIQAIGSVIEAYKQILDDNNLIDFSTIQTEAFYLLKNNPSILAQLHEKIKYIMIDEYQDTNYIQEQIVFMLGGEAKNICVVGDDDQGLYRFRGATIRNILEFPKKFDTCEVVHLDINYRSDAGIVEFYNDWMDTTEGVKWGFDWDNFRYDKQIKPVEASELKSNTVLRL